MKKRIVEALATGLYLGKIPFAPGTWGTLLGLPLVLALHALGPFVYMAASLALIAFAVMIAELHERQTGSHDMGEFVLDEVVGYVIAMTWLPTNWTFLLAAFVGFRFFDIVKPPPIGTLDRKVGGGLGTVLDDVAAGLITNVILQLIYTKTTWLGVGWDGSSLG